MVISEEGFKSFIILYSTLQGNKRRRFNFIYYDLKWRIIPGKIFVNIFIRKSSIE